jgi:hypothetical protein
MALPFLERVFPMYPFQRPESNICSNPLDIEHLFDSMTMWHEHLFGQDSVTPGSYSEPQMAKTPPGNVQQEEKE